MTPRLTKASRAMHCHEIQAMKSPRYLRQGRLASKPSPAERLRQRRKARAAVMRFHRAKDLADRMLTEKDRRENRMIYLNHIYVQNQMKSFKAPVLDWRGPPGELPQSRGTTTGQLVALHLTAEEEAERGGKWYGV